MVSCTSVYDFSDTKQEHGSSRYKGSSSSAAAVAGEGAAASCRSSRSHEDYTDRELILTLHSHFRKKQMSNLQGFYLMDADEDQTIRANDILQIFKDSGLFISLDRVKTLIRGFRDERSWLFEIHG